MGDQAGTSTAGSSPEINPRVTTAQLTIRNSEALINLTKRYDQFIPKIQNPTPNLDNDWFKRINVAKRCEVDHGSSHLIDIQPDYRFPVSYFIYTVLKSYPDLDTRAHPEVSVYSLIAYEIIMLSVHLLTLDLNIRNVPSIYANEFVNDGEMNRYMRNLHECHVNQATALLLENLPGVYDAQRLECLFVPSLASFMFNHDYGRIVPPQIFLTLHNLLATARTTLPVNELLRRFHAKPIVRIGNVDYTTAHFLAGYFNFNGQENIHMNWFNTLIHDFYSPACGRLHVNRPFLAEVPFAVTNYDLNDVSPYRLLLNFAVREHTVASRFIQRTSSFYEGNNDIPSVPYHVILEKVSGVTPLTHSLEEFELPTWHNLPTVTSQEFNDKTQIKNLTADEYSVIIKFKLKDRKKYTGKAPTEKEAPIAARFISKEPFDADKPPYDLQIYKEDDRYRHAFLFQPYSRQLSLGSFAVTLGLKIVNDEIDTSVVPVPNIAQSIHFTNSNFLAGSIPADYITPIVPDANNVIDAIRRVRHIRQINGLAIRDGSQVIVPVFANDQLNYNQGELGLHGLRIEENHDNPDRAYTYAAWSNGAPPIPKKSVKLWSSYRHVEHSNSVRRKVHMYYSFVPFYGLATPISRILHPIDGLP